MHGGRHFAVVLALAAARALCRENLIIGNGIYRQEGMKFEGLIARNAYIFAPLKIVGAMERPPVRSP